MITLITGNKGSGKTKRLIEFCNEAIKTSNGNVIFIEKDTTLTYDISHKARLVDTDSYGISGFGSFHGFLGGICAGDYDITDIIIDSTLKIGGRDLEEFADFIEKISIIAKSDDVNFVFTVSTDPSTIPSRIDSLVTKI